MNISSDLINISSQPFPKRRILDPSKLKGFADDNFRFDENGRKLSKWLKNTAGKGEISLNLKLSSANSISLEESKICCFGKGLSYVLGLPI